jgi:hypothetical protein
VAIGDYIWRISVASGFSRKLRLQPEAQTSG